MRLELGERAHVGTRWRDGLRDRSAVRAPVAVPESQPVRRGTGEAQVAAMDRAVVVRADQHEVAGFVVPTVRALVDVVDVEVARGSAAGHDAAEPVAALDVAADAQRDLE